MSAKDAKNIFAQLRRAYPQDGKEELYRRVSIVLWGTRSRAAEVKKLVEGGK